MVEMVRRILAVASLCTVAGAVLNVSLRSLPPVVLPLISGAVLLCAVGAALVSLADKTFDGSILGRIGSLSRADRTLVVMCMLGGTAAFLSELGTLSKGSPVEGKFGCDYSFVTRGAVQCATAEEYAHALFANPVVITGALTVLTGILLLISWVGLAHPFTVETDLNTKQ